MAKAKLPADHPLAPFDRLMEIDPESFSDIEVRYHSWRRSVRLVAIPGEHYIRAQEFDNYGNKLASQEFPRNHMDKTLLKWVNRVLSGQSPTQSPQS